ncbi:hypothetical protein WJX81_000600 [Elliptochloris bilobata]|uniref:1-phosphatidylinositol 4-kinase n=1 Tax=Elliptochloris bilobata TaxID=381761 RepID=A0AAW1SDQ0_9CHLO
MAVEAQLACVRACAAVGRPQLCSDSARQMRSPYDVQGDMRVVATVKQHGFNVSKSLVTNPPVREDACAEQAGEGWQDGATRAGPGRTLLDCARGAAASPHARGAVSGWALSAAARSHVEVVGCAHARPEVRRLVNGVRRGLLAHQEPVASNEGLGGTYFFSSEAGGRVGIMKPVDEEPLAPNNPKGFVGRALGDPGLKPTVRVGEAAMREVAAYLLDHEHFARVPATVMVKMVHPVFHVALAGTAPDTAMSGSLGSDVSTTGHLALPAAPVKLGSLQEYVAHDCDTSEMGSSRFSVADVHRIGILDLRLFNTDRHAGNILVRRPRASGANLSALARLDDAQLALIPIDHGFCLPEALEPPYFEWQHWPQAMIPFDEEELDYIARLDPEADAALLRAELPGLRDGSLRTLAVACALLKAGAAGGLSLAEIAAVATRPLVGLEEEPSELERACAAARAEVGAPSEDDGGGALNPGPGTKPGFRRRCSARAGALGCALGATAECVEEGEDGGGGPDDGVDSAGSSAGTHDAWPGGLAVAVEALRGSGGGGASGDCTTAGSPMEVSSGGGRSGGGRSGGGAGGAAHGLMALDTPPAGVRSPLLRSADDLLFDLDDEGNPVGSGRWKQAAAPGCGRGMACAAVSCPRF